MRSELAVIAVLVGALSGAAPAGVPQLMSYQGKLVKPNGVPVSGTVELGFGFFDAPEGGELLAYEEYAGVQVQNGIFHVLLNVVSAVIHVEGDLYLEVTLDPQGPAPQVMTPRQRIVSSLFAMKAGDSDKLGGKFSSQFAPATHTHDGSAITTGTVADARIASTIARDNEVMGIVLAADGAGSGLDADLLDGKHAADFASASHTHADLIARIAALEALLAGTTRNANTITFSGVNLQIVNGLGNTRTANSLGNLIVGYNELRGAGDSRTGSHNIVVGTKHNFTLYGGIVAGCQNTISGEFACVTGGQLNTASAWGASVTGGGANNATGNCSSVTGGSNNSASGSYASVSGGGTNTASSSNASVSGGIWNEASGLGASVAGGGGAAPADGNEAFADFSAILGGASNFAGDLTNKTDHTLGQQSTISAGSGNVTRGRYATVSGGMINGANSNYSAVSGGYHNIVQTGSGGSCAGGSQNFVSGENAFIGGGKYNGSSGSHSSVTGGEHNSASGDYASVVGGGGPAAADGNDAFAHYAAVLGGKANIAGDPALADHTKGQQSCVSGGNVNTASGTCSSVSGGVFNDATGTESSILGGWDGAASGDRATIAGGRWNIASGADASVTGGASNTASASRASVSGGESNTASALSASVSGGLKNNAIGDYSSVSGGSGNGAWFVCDSVSGGLNRHTSAGETSGYDWAAGALWQDN